MGEHKPVHVETPAPVVLSQRSAKEHTATLSAELETRMPPLKILTVTGWIPTTEAGGVGTVIRILYKYLSAEHTVHILANDWDSVRLRCIEASGMTLNLRRHRTPFSKQKPVAGFLGWLRDLPLTLWDLKRFIKEQEIEVIHLHYAASYQFYFRILRWLGGPPYLVTLHRGDTVNFSQQNRVDRMLIRAMLRGAGANVAVSGWLAGQAAEAFNGCGEIGVVRNGLDLGEVDAELNRADAAESGFEVPERFLLCVANVTHYKGIDVAIRAWPTVRGVAPDLHLIVAGEPREAWDSCQALLDEFACRDRVHLVGPLRRRQVLKLMDRSLGLVAPSRSEGLPMVLLETGALGRPIVCSEIGPFLEVVTDGETGLVVPVENADALAAAVIRLAGDPALGARLGRALQERVRRDFSADTMVQQYVRLYRQLVTGS